MRNVESLFCKRETPSHWIKISMKNTNCNQKRRVCGFFLCIINPELLSKTQRFSLSIINQKHRVSLSLSLSPSLSFFLSLAPSYWYHTLPFVCTTHACRVHTTPYTIVSFIWICTSISPFRHGIEPVPYRSHARDVPKTIPEVVK
jgi:hypothetical protein